MIKVATANEMQHIDRMTIEKYGIAGTVLMERAGLSVVKRINELFLSEHGRRPEKVIVLAGGGNNGGDGYVIARILHNQGTEVEICMCVGPDKLKGDAKINHDAAGKFGVPMFPVRKFLARRSLRPGCLVIDALLGTGLSSEVREPLSGVIKKINRMSSPVVSVDIPSGISSDTGRIMGCAVRAAHTVTFGLPKRGHLLYPGAEYTGQLFVEDIGFPRTLLESEKIMVNLPQKNDMISLLPARPAYSHKGTYGHALIVAGSKGKTGAALMAARACLRTGAGLVTIGVPESLVHTFQSRVTEEMILPLPDKGNGTLSPESADTIFGFIKRKASVLAIGPGLSADREISKLICMLIAESRVPVVIDADGINALAGKSGILKKTGAPVILTPHAGEMARLLRRTGRSGKRGEDPLDKALIQRIEANRIGTAQDFAKKMKTWLVLKGVPTVTASPGGDVFVNSTGNPGMATAGTGDVLTGMIAAFLAQKLSPRDASVLGVYMHGFIGDIIAKRKGGYSVVASDIVSTIPSFFRSIAS